MLGTFWRGIGLGGRVVLEVVEFALRGKAFLESSGDGDGWGGNIREWRGILYRRWIFLELN